MSLLKTTNNPFSCLAAFNQGADAFCSIVAPDDYRTKYPIDQLFQLPGDSTLFQQDFVGRSIYADHILQQIFVVVNGQLQLVAGKRGIAGFRDGPGDQALFGIGGLQGSTHAERLNSKGEGFVTDAKNNRIRKLVDPGDGGPWMVSTFASGIWTNSLLIDPQDRLLTVADRLYEFAPDGSIARSWPNPAGSSVISGMAMRQDGMLILMTRNNSWDVLISFDRDTGKSVRLAGMTEPEVTAWMTTHGGKTPNDGGLLGEAAYHSPSLVYFDPQGRFAIVGGGDVRGVRKMDFVTGRGSTLFCDGSWRETSIILTAPQPNTNPDQPFYMTQPTGLGVGGYPRQTQYNWIPTGAYRRIQDLQGGTMQKTGTITYGSLTVPANKTLSGVQIDLIATDGSIAQAGPKIAPGTTMVNIDVPDGTGWRLRGTNLDQNGAVLSIAMSAPFDVVGQTIIQVAVSIAVS